MPHGGAGSGYDLEQLLAQLKRLLFERAGLVPNDDHARQVLVDCELDVAKAYNFLVYVFLCFRLACSNDVLLPG